MSVAKKIFTQNGTFAVPAGVTTVTVTAQKNAVELSFLNTNEANGFLLDSAGNIYAWGDNQNGHLGANINPGTTSLVSSPVAVVGGNTFRLMSAGQSNAAFTVFGITQNDALYAWGGNNNGILGGNLDPSTTLSVSSPVLVSGLHEFKKVTQSRAAAYASGVTSSGAIYCWGINSVGQLGDGTIVDKSSPVLVLGGLTFSDVSQTTSTVIGLTTAGAAYGWGNNANGEAGVGDTNTRSSPVAVVGGLTFQSIFTGNLTSFGITTGGAAYGWGLNSSGQLGVNDINPRSSPTAVVGGLTFAQLYPGNAQCFGLTTAGAAYGWGTNGSGLLGIGDVASRSSPVAVLGGLTFSKISCYSTYAMGLTTTGALYAWGGNANGQLGVGDVTPRSSPVLVLGGFTWADMGFDDNGTHSFGITTDGNLYSWGLNTSGQLGLGDIVARSSPVLVVGGLMGSMLPSIVKTTITVTPATNYSIVLNQYFARFGSTIVGSKGVDSILVEFEE